MEIEQSIRRSIRDPSLYHINKKDVKILLNKIKQNHSDTIILKLKDHLLSDIHISVLNEVILALYSNKVCQALYFQNLNFNDHLIDSLINLLKKKKIWCLNIGENYNISTSKWKYFCDSLLDTNITHLYVSEHIISIELKNQMRENIRFNRKKHNLHSSFKNIHIIEKCTNMWWNPINAIRHQLQRNLNATNTSNTKRLKPNSIKLTPNHTAYWAEGVGEGGEKPWKFACSCGERCSSYENYRYHPTGRMYECSICSIWSHTDCVLGNLSDEDIEELENVLCHKCKSKQRRIKLLELKELGIQFNEGNEGVEFTYLLNQDTDILNSNDDSNNNSVSIYSSYSLSELEDTNTNYNQIDMSSNNCEINDINIHYYHDWNIENSLDKIVDSNQSCKILGNK